MSPDELKNADLEWSKKYKTAMGVISPFAPEKPSEVASKIKKANQYNKRLAWEANNPSR